ncbi:hypothetical protein GJAV_G00250190 [Gymnothorax javanicus]|nr:hypothetical protein GJAV_G00250190 [Gymnothorax javanicus]
MEEWSTITCLHSFENNVFLPMKSIQESILIRKKWFCTPLSCILIQAGVCLRRGTETQSLEQHRIRQKEEERGPL